MSALQRHDVRIAAVRDLMDELVGMSESRQHVVGLISGLDVHYDLGEGHPLLGRRMPDLDLLSGGRVVRVYSLLHAARPVLINFGPSGSVALGPWADRVRLVDASYAGAWELPVIGTVDAPVAVLVRPDGHVAWVGDETQSGLKDGLTTWFGTPDHSKRGTRSGAGPTAAESGERSRPDSGRVGRGKRYVGRLRRKCPLRSVRPGTRG